MSKTLLLVLVGLIISGCAISPVNGLVTTQTKWGGTIVDQNVKTINQGQACVTSYFGLFAKGDASVSAAQENGNIEKVSMIEHSTFNLLFLYNRYCTIVTGE